MKTIQGIKPGPKPKKEDGTPDKRRRVTPETKPKHPDLKPHKHKPNDLKSKWNLLFEYQALESLRTQ